jgi:hypothetical protein
MGLGIRRKAGLETEYIRRLAAGDERPFKDAYYTDMLRGAEAAWDDVFVLCAVLSEATIRVRRNSGSKSRRVVELVKPRLEELMNFPFPEEPDAAPGDEPLGSTEDWPQEGVLATMGYHVGSRDPGLAPRRRILREAFEGPIPNVYEPAYMAGWGSDRSVPRLYKLSWSLASFANNQLRKLGGVPDEAVDSWTADLEWLHAELYEGHFGFPWPSIGT